MENKNLSIQDLSLVEQKEINGGNPIWIFIAGSIVGGMIYDAYKAACKAAIDAQVEHPDYYDGPVHSMR